MLQSPCIFFQNIYIAMLIAESHKVCLPHNSFGLFPSSDKSCSASMTLGGLLNFRYKETYYIFKKLLLFLQKNTDSLSSLPYIYGHWSAGPKDKTSRKSAFCVFVTSKLCMAMSHICIFSINCVSLGVLGSRPLLFSE